MNRQISVPKRATTLIALARLDGLYSALLLKSFHEEPLPQKNPLIRQFVAPSLMILFMAVSPLMLLQLARNTEPGNGLSRSISVAAKERGEYVIIFLPGLQLTRF